MLAGELYDASDPQLTAERREARDILRIYNQTTDFDDREAVLRRLFGAMGEGIFIEPQFYCDYGRYTFLGDRVYMNFGCVILDCGAVHIGSDVMFGPRVQVFGAHHPIQASQRVKGPELGSTVRIGDRVWIGGGAIILPGITIGDGSTIGAGSVVTKDIPSNVVAAGNPARILRSLEDN